MITRVLKIVPEAALFLRLSKTGIQQKWQRAKGAITVNTLVVQIILLLPLSEFINK